MTTALLLCGLLLAAAEPPSRLLTLDQALQTAAEQQPQLRAAHATQRGKQAAVGVALARYLPSLDGALNYQRSTGNFEISPSFSRGNLMQVLVDPATGKIDMKSSWASVNYLTGNATLTVPIYDFGRTGGAYDAAVAGQEESESSIAKTQINVAMDVRVRYYTALAERDLVQVSQDTLDNQHKHVDEISQMVGAGTRPKIDLSSAQVNYDTAELTLVRQQNAFSVAKVLLNQAMGVENDIDYGLTVPSETPLEAELQSLDQVMAEALQARPEFAEMAAQIAQADAGRIVARAAYFPALSGSSRINGSKVDNLPWGWNWFVGVGLNWNFFNGNLAPQQTAEAEAQVAALQATRDGLHQQVRAELMQQRLAVQEAKHRVIVATHAAATADERLELAEGRYKAGVSSVLELDDAQVSKVKSHFEKVQAQYDLSTARARLLHAMGKSS